MKNTFIKKNKTGNAMTVNAIEAIKERELFNTLEKHENNKRKFKINDSSWLKTAKGRLPMNKMLLIV